MLQKLRESDIVREDDITIRLHVNTQRGGEGVRGKGRLALETIVCGHVRSHNSTCSPPCSLSPSPCVVALVAVISPAHLLHWFTRREGGRDKSCCERRVAVCL